MNHPSRRPAGQDNSCASSWPRPTTYGMPGSVVVVLDDVAAMLGLYEPLPQAAATHVAGPMVAWRTHPQAARLRADR